jgi:hypothetical protein
MSASVQIKINHGSTPTLTSAESGFTFGRDDIVVSETPIPKPDALGTNYSFAKTLHLHVVSGGGSTSISNRKIRLGSSLATGLYMYFKNGTDTYNQATDVIYANNTTANGFVPSGWTLLTTDFQVWDNDLVSATNNTINGDYVLVALGVAYSYIGGAGAQISIPNIIIQYDEQ